MNNRYLCRAKRKNWRELPKDKWWVEGYYAYMKPCHYIMPKENYGSWIEIDEKTLCACTGLKDKNGKLIWENDIIRYEGMLFVVKWNDACAHFTAYKVRERTRCTPVTNSGTMKITEVIGNIFDNMELLETGKEAGHQVNQNLLMPAT